jgi:ribose/xylose/arabinose/galactoside ABC-type transport system permease subunit
MDKKMTIKSVTNLIKNNLIVVGITILIIVASIVEPRFLTGGNIENIIRQFGVLIVVALGMTFIIMGGCIDLSVSGLISLGVVVTVTLVDPIDRLLPSLLVSQ